ncbi:hypothetical protein ABRZ24_16755 [Brenneria populi]|uniref:Uncharacterized protein n=1 Tax=Brenneria populi TaxID=1505588 RepID=A0ABU6JTZ2_9GAMM|nr:hypothetical protein [Brenneria populi Li et al. 2015]
MSNSLLIMTLMGEFIHLNWQEDERVELERLLKQFVNDFTSLQTVEKND